MTRLILIPLILLAPYFVEVALYLNAIYVVEQERKADPEQSFLMAKAEQIRSLQCQ